MEKGETPVEPRQTPREIREHEVGLLLVMIVALVASRFRLRRQLLDSPPPPVSAPAKL